MTDQPFRLADQEYDPAADMRALHEHPDNPNQGDIGAISESLDAHGFYGAVIAQKSTGAIVAGNHRYRTALVKGAKTIPVFWLDVDDEQAARILAVDNRSTHLATFDDAMLAKLLTPLAGTATGLAGTGYDGDDLDTLITKLGGGFTVTGAPTGAGYAETDEEHEQRELAVKGYADRKAAGALVEMILVFNPEDREEVGRLLDAAREALGDKEARAAALVLRALRVMRAAMDDAPSEARAIAMAPDE